MQTCPLCGARLESRFTEAGRNHRRAVLLKCSKDGRHFLAFVNDVKSIQRALAANDPAMAAEPASQLRRSEA